MSKITKTIRKIHNFLQVIKFINTTNEVVLFFLLTKPTKVKVSKNVLTTGFSRRIVSQYIYAVNIHDTSKKDDTKSRERKRSMISGVGWGGR